jgi:hypothetical protein
MPADPDYREACRSKLWRSFVTLGNTTIVFDPPRDDYPPDPAERLEPGMLRGIGKLRFSTAPKGD